MKFHFTISLQQRLALTYVLFIGAALGGLSLAINFFTARTFNALIKENISGKSEEIVRVMGDLYNPLVRNFDGPAVEALGMHFVHEGYIVTVEDRRGEPVWDARSCDMEQCVEIINDIAFRMERDFRLKGGIEKQRRPVLYNGRTVGTVNIETYGPFFYSETETRFLRSANRILLIAGAVLALLGAGISIPLSRSIARPVLRAGEAARRIAQIHSIQAVSDPSAGPSSAGADPGGLVIRIQDQYKTRELRDLSRSINDLALELEEGERRQRQLIADVAHELRTPLTCLQGNMEAMIDGVYTPDREHLESCHEEIMRLSSLVADLNILANLEGPLREPGEVLAGPGEGEKSRNLPRGGPAGLNKTNFDLARLVQAAAEQFVPAVREKGINLHLDLRESPVIADYDRLKQVFINLLSNAVKYTDRGSVCVAVTGAKTPGAVWDVTVADTGIGIPEKDLPHIFERFYRSDKSRSRSTGGAGIGLAIAAAIVRAHGGTITAESPCGEGGTLFRVRL
ncbi:MAG: two-component sensor histidine kinase [Spirochaetaceae bacterium]|jgi:signal transduction histidine kinase|nr:two-component sensor histidine kinase [Spirochaetaceae bacterium]